MADSHAETAHDHVKGEMEISAQNHMFELFIAMTKWCSLGVSALLVLLVVWFAVGAGFIPAFISAAVVTAVGIFALRGKKEAAH
ncbi:MULTISPECIES: aa3-type cytochrome c oxidase subunit IV [unclassified Brevundimonas]|uniref:aa3-type cytochrome c oxidase subunit IV n=1 Tax=unclassified Brevundimonas TaxID=2622653 RepID=UPI0025C128EF|nr:MULTISPECIES: aa3-type cytochrome c oxidase subunit IV [unclassified Brevundimonas]